MHINDILRRLGQGAAVEELDSSILHACQQAIAKDGKAEVTLKLAILPNGEDGVEIHTTVGCKTPTTRHAKTFLFVDGDGEITVTDPKQGVLDVANA